MAFRLLLAALSLAFVWIIWPYAGAVFWAAVLALLFEPLQARLARRWKGRATLAALATLGIILVIVILPLAFISASLLQEITTTYQKLRTGQMDVGHYFSRFLVALPSW
ncbi:MAG: AI-2E family transporter, partial [Pseudomonadota bacterium]|nr:AI-2E family transporter [Pseudomonadota bacterium]